LPILQKWRGSSGTVTTIAAADYSEYMPAKDEVEHADIVSLSNEPNPNKEDKTAPFLLQRSQKPYQSPLIGVVSSFAGSEKPYGFYQPIALVGRVPVKVSTQNGSIAIGDRITSSSLAGTGMKATNAGQTVGIALQLFDGSGASSTTALLPNGTSVAAGKILVFINVGYQGNDLNVGIMNNELGIMDTAIVDKNGNQLALTFEGTVVIKRLVVKDLELAKGGTITLPAGEGGILGKVTISQGLTYAIVENPLVDTSSYIFLTQEGTPLEEISYGVVNKKEGQFTIQLSKGAQEAMTFAYWIIQSYDAGAIREGNATSTTQ